MKKLRKKNSQEDAKWGRIQSLLDFDTTGGRIASLDEFMAMTIVGSVVEINSKDFNVASVLSSVDRQNH